MCVCVCDETLVWGWGLGAGGGGGGGRVLMFVPLVYGTAAVCTEARISRGLNDGVCVCVCVRACVFSWYRTDVTDTHSFPSRLRAPENRSSSASCSTPPNPLLFSSSPLVICLGPSAHADERKASTAAQQDHTRQTSVHQRDHRGPVRRKDI